MQNTTDTILIILATATGVLALLQFVVLVGVFFAMRKAMATAKQYGTELHAAVTPFIQQSTEVMKSTRQLINRLEPKLDAAAGDLAEITRTARVQMVKFEASTDDINERLRRQAARIDGMTTSTLNGVDRVGHFIGSAVSVPVRQASGIMAAAKAIFESLRAPSAAKSRASARAEYVRDETNVVM